MTLQWLGICVTVLIFAVTNICGLVYLLGNVSATLKALNTDLQRLAKVLEKFEAERYTKSDAEKDFLIRDTMHEKEHKAMWRRIDGFKQSGASGATE